MNKKTSQDADLLRKMGYETRDVVVRTLVRWTVGLFVFVAIAAVISLGYYKVVAPNRAERVQNQPMVAQRRLPPDPRLQAVPATDMEDYNAQVESRLSSYGTTQDAGYYHIPIDRAIDLTAERGLPHRASPGAATPVAPPGAAPSIGAVNPRAGKE